MHRTKEGLENITTIKRGMNTGRLLNNGLISTFGKLEIIR
jgi:hypothetical protein